MREISVAKDYSRFPAGRFVTDGPFSGERFRDELLAPALRESDRVVVELDGTMGYGSSFLEEAFGGLVRVCGFKFADLKDRLEIRSSDTSVQAEAWEYVRDARPE